MRTRRLTRRRRAIATIYRERRENQSLAVVGSTLLFGVCVCYALLLATYLFKLATMGPTAEHPLSWWIAIFAITTVTLAGFFLLALYLRHIARCETPFKAQRTWMLFAAAALLAARCVIDSVTSASSAEHALDGYFVRVLDGTVDKYLCIAGMATFSLCVASILNYCSMLQDDADTIN